MDIRDTQHAQGPQNANAEEPPLTRAMREISNEVVLTKGTILSQKLIYYLIDGVCSLMFTSKDGDEYSFMYFKKGMLLNFLPTVAKHGTYASITEKRFRRMQHVIFTKTECRLLCTPGEMFLTHMEKSLVLHQLLVRSLTENWINLLALSTGITACPVGMRVCQLIVDSLPTTKPYIIPRYLTYPEIAAHLSMHIITVTKIFRVLREQGIITKVGNTHQVVDLSRLDAIAEGFQPIAY